jgi:AraC family transcriptional regulator of adaptative response/methylated-DNA-[protein]-cysteine methyltransferase
MAPERQRRGDEPVTATIAKSTIATPSAAAALRPAALDLDRCWQAVEKRDRGQDGAFVFAVKTTGVFCRPSCAARLPLRKNVAFYASNDEAAAAGFRPCKRCKPTETEGGAERIAKVCDYIRQNADSGDKLGLAELAEVAGLSPSHLQRVFRAALGVSPRQYVEACRLGLLKKELRAGETVTDAIYAAGFGASSRLYEKVDSRLGMTPKQYGQGGKGQTISYTVLPSPFGRLLLAATDRGLCFVELGEDEEGLVEGLRREYPQAKIAPQATPSSPELESWGKALQRHLEGQAPRPELPLDVRASAFQFQVWSYLQTIPRGEVRTYQEVAAAIGRPKAMRAVGSACAKNPTALIVPCHRVIRGDGAIGGYRWGEERKRRLLESEGVKVA